jgi:hypothetical protein
VFSRVLPSDVKLPFPHRLGKFISTRHNTRPIGYAHKLKNAVQSTSVMYVSKASIVLCLSVAANNAFGFQLNPHQKLNIIFIIILANNGFCPNQGFNAGWNKPSFLFNNRQQGGNGQNFNRNEPSLRDIIRDEVRINDEVGKKIYATDKLLENINAKMDNFIVAT